VQVKALFMRADTEGSGELTTTEFFNVLHSVTACFCAKRLNLGEDSKTELDAVDRLAHKVVVCLTDWRISSDVIDRLAHKVVMCLIDWRIR
jgi:hypothetical protein